MKHKEKHKCHT